jgi:hypothetical protein
MLSPRLPFALSILAVACAGPARPPAAPPAAPPSAPTWQPTAAALGEAPGPAACVGAAGGGPTVIAVDLGECSGCNETLACDVTTSGRRISLALSIRPPCPGCSPCDGCARLRVVCPLPAGLAPGPHEVWIDGAAAFDLAIDASGAARPDGCFSGSLPPPAGVTPASNDPPGG